MSAFLATVTLLMASTSAQADGVQLRWGLKNDDVFYTKTVTKMEQKLRVNGQDVKQDLDQTVVHGYKVTKADKEGFVIEQTILDSQSAGSLAAGAAAAGKKMRGTVFKFTFDKDFEVKQIEGLKEYVDKMSDGNALVKQILESSINEDVMKASLHEIFRVGSAKPMNKGDDWTKDYKLPLGALGDVTSKLKYKLDDIKDGVALVSSSGKGDYGTPKRGAGGGITVTEAKVKIEKLDTSFQFDLKAKRMKEIKTEMRMIGPMTMSVNGREVAMEMDSTHASVVTVLEKNPVEQ